MRNLPKYLSRIDVLLPPVLHESCNRDQIVQKDKSCRDGEGAPQSRCFPDTGEEPAVPISEDRGKLPRTSVEEDHKLEKVEIEGGGEECDDDGEYGEVLSCVLQQLSEQMRLEDVVEFEQEDDFLKVIEVVLR